MEVLNNEKDVMKVEILQVGPRGDLVIGTHERHVASFQNGTTHVEWFKLMDVTQEVTAEVCMVVRYQEIMEENRNDQKRKSQSSPSELPNLLPKSVNKEQKTLKKTGSGVSKKMSKPMPMPIAIGLGVLFGALAYLQSKKPRFYEVQEGDTLCSIGICFNRNYRNIADENTDIIEDPNVIYPGDRIKIV
eukprot:TRINITY_DN29491_c0_g1_i3.p2 TRINITY_DN29491_c0_g1~~TRINITY_DN29491_c0_g1_i3.p2  ORF type:complete len:217 (-),score=31.75 TRINITY_DN29491_c0_g1_i3:205-771(-)